MGTRVYLRKSWAGDLQRRARAGVDQDVVFGDQTTARPRYPADLDTAGVLPPWATDDEV